MCGIAWNSMYFHAFPCISPHFPAFPRISMHFRVFPCISMMLPVTRDFGRAHISRGRWGVGGGAGGWGWGGAFLSYVRLHCLFENTSQVSISRNSIDSHSFPTPGIHSFLRPLQGFTRSTYRRSRSESMKQGVTAIPFFWIF